MSQPMRDSLHDCLTSLLTREDFGDGFTSMMCQAVEDENFQQAVAKSLSGAVSDPTTRRALLHLFIEGLQDEDLHEKITSGALHAVTEGLKIVSKDDELKSVLKETLIESLRDKELHNAAMEGAMGAVKFGIKEALCDPELRDLFKAALKDSLQDEEIHKATLKGAADALFPPQIAKFFQPVQTPTASTSAAHTPGFHPL
eukprot:GEMP01052463.1.p1 GENE.GEMP01052463.1~~GEMP01052463.1.p1  ORF type:complete len:200 (+),score=52.14 GEMP01052463.1:291-890(+)